MLSATVHDVLYYMSPIYRQDIINAVLHTWSFYYIFFLLIINYPAKKAHLKNHPWILSWDGDSIFTYIYWNGYSKSINYFSKLEVFSFQPKKKEVENKKGISENKQKHLILTQLFLDC
jgi:hypothetical protein